MPDDYLRSIVADRDRPRLHALTDRAIAGQLKALADGLQRRAEKASHVDAAKAFARSAANAEGE